jgi:RecB family exonuclease
VNAAKGCLRRHFLQRVVGIAEDLAPVGGPRFGRRDLGQLLHAAFQRALESPHVAPEDVAAEVLAPSRLGGFERVFAERELARSVALLRRREEATRGPLAVALPWLERRLGGTEGVALGTGAGAFALVGQVDRVDLAGSRAVVVDYKLGKSAPGERVKETVAGKDLQLPLYACALEREAGYEVVGLEWLAGTHRARASLVRADQVALFAPRQEGRAPHELDPEAFRALLEQAEREAAGLVARIRAGESALAPSDPGQCPRCPMFGPCRPDRAHVAALAIAAGRGGGDEDAEDDA